MGTGTNSTETLYFASPLCYNPPGDSMRIHVSSLGCKLNQSEMDTLATQLASLGHTVVALPQEADLCVLNTCAVTHGASKNEL